MTTTYRDPIADLYPGPLHQEECDCDECYPLRDHNETVQRQYEARTPDEKGQDTTEAKAVTLFLMGYDESPTIYPGIRTVYTPDDKTYQVNLIKETCSCPYFNRTRRPCCHFIADRKLVLEGKAQGMPGTWIADHYDPSIVSNADLMPELDLTTTFERDWR